MRHASTFYHTLQTLTLSVISIHTALTLSAQTAEQNQQTIETYERLIPRDKNLDPTWLASLTEREPARPAYTSAQNELDYIGMPVGGMMAGTVYLGGDGKLWLWEIFNRQHEGIRPYNAKNAPEGWPWKGKKITIRPRDGARFIEPLKQESAFEQGFALRLKNPDGTQTLRSLDKNGFKDIRFTGSYPLAKIDYATPGIPVRVQLTSYSPFIPLNADDSSLPVTLLEYTLTNNSNTEITGDLFGWTQNPVLLDTFAATPELRSRIQLTTQRHQTNTLAALRQTADLPPQTTPAAPLCPFNAKTFAPWKNEGDAFGNTPQKKNNLSRVLGDTRLQPGETCVSSFTQQRGEKPAQADAKTGKLTSADFVIKTPAIRFMIAGGKDIEKLNIALIIDGKTIRRSTGKNSNALAPAAWDTTDLIGKTAHLEITDNATGNWGHILIANIEAADLPIDPQTTPDLGDLTLALLKSGTPNANTFFHDGIPVPGQEKSNTSPGVGSTFHLRPGESTTITFAYAWYFPNLSLRFYRDPVGRSYANRFNNSAAIADYLATNYPRLSTDTKLWVKTWDDSTLPHWLLDRATLTLDTMATENVYRFKDGRLWGWEGVGACNGLCTHVWHYAQSLARLFPELARNMDERTYFGDSILREGKNIGAIGIRLENERWAAADGQAGVILGAFREYQMSPDDTFLRRIWPSVKLAMQYLINEDGNDDGMLEGKQHNTLDANWYGKVPSIASLYLAALRASEEMSTAMNDTPFAQKCRSIYLKGYESIKELFRDDFGYFIQIESPQHTKEIGTGIGCYIDQTLGQWWARQLDLGDIMDNTQTKRALEAIWTHNFVTEYDSFRRESLGGRPYAGPGDRATIMCTWPQGGLRPEFRNGWQFGYFNESMTGFEWSYAASLIYEGKTTQGLAAARAIHDRYDAKKRNPFNEIECSDHYARAMSSYSVFLAVCGYTYNGPEGRIAFTPRLHPENFRAAFTAAEGWGSFAQQIRDNTLSASLEIKYGTLNLRELNLTMPDNKTPKTITATLDGQNIPLNTTTEPNGRTHLQFKTPITLRPGQPLNITMQ